MQKNYAHAQAVRVCRHKESMHLAIQFAYAPLKKHHSGGALLHTHDIDAMVFCDSGSHAHTMPIRILCNILI